ncbi:hypothetical protein HU200_020654 [Digitaria exilis]|uniref:Uncharacterized protein n=1 Tax=Digitaria exilis TaxID=1010633 RepID=A0A835F0V7_9POAL|nr:hypothetical protein HU200_020654 [Digitaria exilis]
MAQNFQWSSFEWSNRTDGRWFVDAPANQKLNLRAPWVPFRRMIASRRRPQQRPRAARRSNTCYQAISKSKACVILPPHSWLQPFNPPLPHGYAREQKGQSQARVEREELGRQFRALRSEKRLAVPASQGTSGGVDMDSGMAEEPSAAAAARGGAGQLAPVAEEGEGAAVAQAPPAAAGSTETMERVAAAKKFIEDHYKAQMNNLQERKQRYRNPNLPSSQNFPDQRGCDLDRSRVGAG